MAIYCKKHRTRGMCLDCAKEKREASEVCLSSGLTMRQSIAEDAILLIKTSLSDCHLPDLISCLQTTRASLKLKAEKLIELSKRRSNARISRRGTQSA